MRPILIILILGLCGSLLLAYHQYQKANRLNGILVEHDYDLARDITITRMKANERLLEVGYDRNRDLENDSVVAYAANGRVCQILSLIHI